MSRSASLLAQLRRYEPAGELEAGHRLAMVELLSAADEAFSRSHFVPGHVTASCFDLDVHAIPAGKGEPDHAHFDVRYLARTARPDSVAIDRTESNDLAWFDLARAAELMPGPESQRVLRKIERLLHERSPS